MDALIQDLRYTFRTLAKRPGFTAMVVLTLALGIGASTAVFSVVDGVLLRSLPYPNADRLVSLWEDHRERGGPAEELFSPPNFLEVRERTWTLDGVAAMLAWEPVLTGTDRPERLHGADVSHEYFRLLGVRPARGRLFRPEDEAAGRRPVVLSHGLWHGRFGGEDIVGRTVRLDGEAYTVVGVAQPGFDPPGPEAEIWRPMRTEAARGAWRFHLLTVFGRLVPDATLEQARREVETIAGRLAAASPERNGGKAFRAAPLRDRLVGELRASLLVLLGAVGFLLLIACVNVANLLLARAGARGREVAIRTALGADRRRLLRQFLTESVVLALLGGALGALGAVWTAALIRTALPAEVARVAQIAIDGRVLAVALALSVGTGIAFGALPGARAARLGTALAAGGDAFRAGLRARRARGALVIAQIAIALTLLIGAGLLARSFIRLLRVDPGFRTADVLAVDLSLPGERYGPEQVGRFYRTLVDRLDARPDVRSAGAVNFLPLTGDDNDAILTIEGREAASADAAPLAWYRFTAGDYFRAMGIPLRRGRTFDARDFAEDGRGAVVVNETFARDHLPEGDPLGRRIRPEWMEQGWLTVVGVVGDVRHSRLDRNAVPEFYLPARGTASMTVVAHTRNDPLAAVPAVRGHVAAMDAALPLGDVATIEGLLGRSVAQPRLNLVLFGGFAAVALLLAVLGVYGVAAHTVVRRRREIGVRTALGATRRDVIRLVAARGAALAGIGLALGVALALVLSRTMAGLLHEVSPTDPMTFVAVAALLGAAALAAAYVPARRAATVDPMRVLSDD